MLNKKPTFQAVLYNRKLSKSNKYPIRLRVTYKRDYRLISLDISLSKTEFNKLSSSKLRDENLRVTRDQINTHLQRAKSLVGDACVDGVFDFITFKSLFLGIELAQKNDKLTLPKHYESYIKSMKESGRVSTYQLYECAITSLLKFKPSIDFKDLTIEFLESYEKNMLDSGRSVTTISMYLRTLRTIFNNAIESGDVEQKAYPFSKRKYQIPAVRNIKKALTKEEIKLLIDYKAEFKSSKDKARDMFIFSYLCNGLNIKDIVNLKLKDVEGDRIRVIRAKTKRKLKSSQKPLDIYLHKMAREIIEKWGTPYGADDDFVFDILHKGVTPLRERVLIQNFTQFINKNIDKICKQVGINKPVRTYWARHSFASILNRSGVSREYLSDALGHSSLATTEIYLNGFSDEQKETYSKMLLLDE